ncbi:preprotein translocase subunit SecE [Anaerococcus sp. AGMB00486]|uniref:Protein translocase subunit SecE n=2 Tax=Anaerococcus TaxID=165779 RepID=A0ABX2N7R9_9FIRM|nr:MULTISPECIES: preprotein translocase subunit SecE [Anaerococcus]MDY3006108.1 preprotein translocase subunit SecE [Anaerococcus porci]MSS78400.1 preprotein translocase subunit SecE [Anaerococcus porci]NVF10693.1 preprotein translocase subunit SecE [Anaerococcus faecalis]
MAKKNDGFLKSTKREFKKITWPTKNETLNYSLLVIIVSVITGLLIWLLDIVFGNILGLMM